CAVSRWRAAAGAALAVPMRKVGTGFRKRSCANKIRLWHKLGRAGDKRRLCAERSSQHVNYRHAFHAGGFADVFKHVVLCRILHYLRAKPAAFRVIDTHAGAGLYDLAARQPSRGGEWHDGIERLMAAQLAAPVAALLAPYLEVIGALNERGRLKTYPGSPALAPAGLPPQDRLIACEIEPQAAAALRQNLRGDTRIKTLEIDG